MGQDETFGQIPLPATGGGSIEIYEALAHFLNYKQYGLCGTP